MQTAVAPRLAPRVRIAPERLDLSRRSLRVYAQLLTPRVVRGLHDQPACTSSRVAGFTRDRGPRGAERCAEDLVFLFNAGLPVADAWRVVQFLEEVVNDLYLLPHHDRRELERLEQLADVHEDSLQAKGWFGEHESPAQKEERADALDRQSAINRSLARRLRYEARQARDGAARAAGGAS